MTVLNLDRYHLPFAFTASSALCCAQIYDHLRLQQQNCHIALKLLNSDSTVEFLGCVSGTTEACVLLGYQVASLVIGTSPMLEPAGSLPVSLEPCTGIYVEPDQFIPHSRARYSEILFGRTVYGKYSW
jgi:hypothetical protein